MIKNFNDWVNESTTYSTGIGSDNYVYSTKINNDFYNKCHKILTSEIFKKTNEGKYAFTEAYRLSKMWNTRSKDSWPVWAKSGEYAWKLDTKGNVKAQNFISIPKLIIAVSKEITIPVKCQFTNHERLVGKCFENSINWTRKNNGEAIGGICTKADLEHLNIGTIIIHAFCKKRDIYYEVTFNKENTEKMIYYPLFKYAGNSDVEFAELSWIYGNSIEKAVHDYINEKL